MAQAGMLDEAVHHSEQVNQIMMKNIQTGEEKTGYTNYISGKFHFKSFIAIIDIESI
jgi:hypothetical protein